MIVERLFEAAMRLSKAAGKPFLNMHMAVADDFFAVANGNLNSGTTFKRRSVLTVLDSRSKWVVVGNAVIDLNGMILSIAYDDNAPWWVVGPVKEALEGK